MWILSRLPSSWWCNPLFFISNNMARINPDIACAQCVSLKQVTVCHNHASVVHRDVRTMHASVTVYILKVFFMLPKGTFKAIKDSKQELKCSRYSLRPIWHQQGQLHHWVTELKQCWDGKARGEIFIAVMLILHGLSHTVMADKGLSEKPPSNRPATQWRESSGVRAHQHRMVYKNVSTSAKSFLPLFCGNNGFTLKKCV